jgi:hypothetical protein
LWQALGIRKSKAVNALWIKMLCIRHGRSVQRAGAGYHWYLFKDQNWDLLAGNNLIIKIQLSMQIKDLIASALHGPTNR